METYFILSYDVSSNSPFEISELEVENYDEVWDQIDKGKGNNWATHEVLGKEQLRDLFKTIERFKAKLEAEGKLGSIESRIY